MYACNGVSMLHAVGFRSKVVYGYIPTIASSAGVFGPPSSYFSYTVRRFSTWSRYSDAKFALVAVRRSPPEPFTHSTRVVSPVSGSLTEILADVLPPPVFVMRASAPRMFDR